MPVTHGQAASGTATDAAAGSLAYTLGGSTILGSTLFVGLFSDTDMGTITPPSGAHENNQIWVFAGKAQNGSGVQVQAYYLQNAGVQTAAFGAHTWTYTGTGGGVVSFQEYKGCNAVSLDGSPVAATGTGANPASGALSVARTNDAIIWIQAQYNAAATTITYSSPLSTFVITAQGSVLMSTGHILGVLLQDKLVSSNGSPYTTGVTSTVTANNASLMLALSADAPPTNPPPGAGRDFRGGFGRTSGGFINQVRRNWTGDSRKLGFSPAMRAMACDPRMLVGRAA